MLPGVSVPHPPWDMAKELEKEVPKQKVFCYRILGKMARNVHKYLYIICGAITNASVLI